MAPPIRTSKYYDAHRYLHGINASLKAFKGFVYDGQGSGADTLDGLTGVMKNIFCPMELNVSTGGAKTGGSARGMQVDRELAGLINQGKFPDSDSLCAYTVKTLEYLYANDLQPLVAQPVAANRALNLATALDMVCMDSRGKLVGIQLKTGFENKLYHTARGYFHSPFVADSCITKMEDSHHNRHMLQVTIEHILAQVDYGNPLDRSMWLVVTSNEVKAYTLPNTKEHFYFANDVYTNLEKRHSKPMIDLEIVALKKARAAQALKKVMKGKANKANKAAALKRKQK